MSKWATRYRLRIDEPYLLLNEWLRIHRNYRQANEYKYRWRWLLRGTVRQLPAMPLRGLARIHVERGNSGKAPDQDGLIGGFKPVLDLLCACRLRKPLGMGFIVDDSPQYLEAIAAEHVKTKRGHGFTTIKILERKG